MGTMAASCLGVSGRASGSLFAAAVMALSSSVVGILTEGRLVTLDIVFVLTTIGATQADEKALFGSASGVNGYAENHKHDTKHDEGDDSFHDYSFPS
jgi:hypothetical protein